jgi:hypothetical protein
MHYWVECPEIRLIAPQMGKETFLYEEFGKASRINNALASRAQGSHPRFHKFTPTVEANSSWHEESRLLTPLSPSCQKQRSSWKWKSKQMLDCVVMLWRRVSHQGLAIRKDWADTGEVNMCEHTTSPRFLCKKTYRDIALLALVDACKCRPVNWKTQRHYSQRGSLATTKPYCYNKGA